MLGYQAAAVGTDSELAARIAIIQIFAVSRATGAKGGQKEI